MRSPSGRPRRPRSDQSARTAGQDASLLAELRPRLRGELVLPGDEAYPRRRLTFTAEGEPAVIARCRDPQDVRLAIGYARRRGWRISVRSGGHGSTGHGTNDGGMVIDLSGLNSVQLLDRAAGTVRVGAGATWSRVAEVLTAEGLAISAGDTGNVGVGGLLLGGGIGWMVRRYGLALDSLRAAEIVTADGRFIRASESERADLFWAIRGGGGNLGILTAVELVARPHPRVVFGTVRFPGARVGDVLARWGAVLPGLPEELTTTVTAVAGPGGRSGQPGPVSVGFCYAGEDAVAAERALASILRIGQKLNVEPEVDLAVKPYDQILENVGEPGSVPGMRAVVRSGFCTEVGGDLAARLTNGLATIPPLILNVRHLGGAVGRIDPGATAYAYRRAQALVVGIMMGPALVLDQEGQRFDEFWAGLAPEVFGAYVNFLSNATEADVAAVYPDPTYRRIAEVKGRYDPDNVFDRNHNVRPLTRSGDE